MIDELMQKLGFTDKESQIFLSLIEYGKLSVTDISKKTKINRTTVYSVTKELMAKNLIIEDIGQTNRYYSPAPTTDLHQLYLDEEKKLKEKKTNTEELIKQLAVIPKTQNYSVPKIRFIEEDKINDFLYKQLPIWIESSKGNDPNWWGFQDVSLLEEYSEWTDYHWKIFPKDAGTRLFTNKKPAETKMSKKGLGEQRQSKYWDKSVDFTATHTVLGDYVLFIVTRQHPYYLVETHDAVMAENLRLMFKAMWGKI